MVRTDCGDYTHLPNIAKEKIKKRKGDCRECAKQQGNNNILSIYGEPIFQFVQS